MLKRLLSLFLIFLIIVLPFSITSHASSVEPIGWILELLQMAYSIESKRADVAEMSPDEFYEFMVNDNSFDTLLWKALVDTMAGPFSFTIDNAVDDMKEAKYNAGKVHKDELAKIYEQATKINTANLRFYSFEDLGLSSYSEIKSTITYIGYNCIPHMGKEYDENLLDGTYTRADDDSYIQYYNGSMAFPVIWVPSNCVLYQNGVALPTMAWIIPLGYNACIVVGEDKHTLQVFTTNSGESIYDLRIGFKYDSSINWYPWVHEDGKGFGMVNTGEKYSGWAVADLLSKMVGYCISTGNDNAGQLTPPTDVPYDDDGYVYVCVPEDHSDIIYLSPTTYNEYIDNGTIIENDYVSNVTDETINNITNNITNIYEGSSYDDTNLLNKLEGWFSELYKKIDKLADSLEPSNVINNVYNTYINPPPVYETFSDCFYDNVPAAAEAKHLFNDLCSVTETDLDIDTDVPSDGTVTDETLELSYKIAFYNPFSETKKTDEYEIINFDWYAPYREDIRNLLKISAYVMGFCAILSAIKSVFGIHGGGE